METCFSNSLSVFTEVLGGVDVRQAWNLSGDRVWPLVRLKQMGYSVGIFAEVTDGFHKHQGDSVAAHNVRLAFSFMCGQGC